MQPVQVNQQRLHGSLSVYSDQRLSLHPTKHLLLNLPMNFESFYPTMPLNILFRITTITSLKLMFLKQIHSLRRIQASMMRSSAYDTLLQILYSRDAMSLL